ncbi:DNA adenine methylase [Salmonella enterica subsp. enterica]|nr:DNA adenine methylase [Salmonella enterica subsp. enterica]ECJ4522103.1 DNA adenine methylase [Salmonella enterica subsp. enterica]
MAISTTSPIIPWIGGKRRLARRILPLFPAHQCYVEPFCGGAALYFMKTPSKIEVVNDINGDIINLYRVIKFHFEEFIRQLKWTLISRQLYDWLKHTPTETMTDIQRAARFYYIQKMAFGGKVTCHTFGAATTTPPRLNLNRVVDELEAAHLRLSRTFIENKDWEACVRKYDRKHTLFYCDPPYMGAETYGVEFRSREYEKMAELANTIKGKMLISLNDTPETRRIFHGMEMESVDIRYTLGGGPHMINTKITNKELIIRNWKNTQ